MAWKSQKSAYVIADSAITGAAPLRDALSSFGERHARGPAGANVAQGAIKVIPLGAGGALTFAGDVRNGYAIADALKTALQGGSQLIAALNQAFSSVGPFSRRRGVQVLVAVSDTSGRPHVLAVDSSNVVVNRVDSCARFGSMAPGLQEYAQSIATELAAAEDEGRAIPPGVLVAVIAFLQSLTIHAPLIDQGVGGHFTGALFSEGVGLWQPDILFGLYDSSASPFYVTSVFSIVRGEMACVGSAVTRDTRCFGHRYNSSELEAWKATHLDEVTGFSKRGVCDYFVFLDTHVHRTVIVEMRRNHEHRHLRIEPVSPSETSSGLDLSPDLHAILTAPLPQIAQMDQRYIPYEPPPAATAPS